jgi:Tol biopolymer transport system component
MPRPTMDTASVRRLARVAIAMAAALASAQCLGDFLPPKEDAYELTEVGALTDTLNVGDTVTAPIVQLKVNGKVTTTSWHATVLTGSDVVSTDATGAMLRVHKPGTATVRVRPVNSAITDTTLHADFTLLAVAPRVIITGPDTAYSIGDTLQSVAVPATRSGVAIPGPAIVWTVVGQDTAAKLIDATTGRVRAVKNGSVRLRAKTDTAAAEKVVFVVQRAATISVTSSGFTLTSVGSTQGLTASALDARNTPMAPGAVAITWASLNPNVATVNSAGVVTAVSSGQTTIAASGGGTAGYSLVTVAAPKTTPVNLWAPVSSGTTANLNGVWGVADTAVYAVGTNGVIRKWNGSSWGGSASNTTENLNSVWGTGSTNIYAAGTNGALRLYNGTAWTTVTTGVSTPLLSVWGWSPTGVYVGSTGTVLGNLSGTWSTGPSLSGSIAGIWGSYWAGVYAVTQTNSPSMYLNTGSAWSSSGLPSGSAYNAIWGMSGGEAIAAGDAGIVARYNGAWTTSIVGGSTSWKSIWGSGASDIYMAGSGDQVARWNGSAWTTTSTGSGVELRGIWGFGNDVWAVGVGGAIMRGYRGGSVTVAPATPTISSIGSTQQLTPTAKDPSGATLSAVAASSYAWTTSDPAIATVSSTGLVTAVAGGTASICATAPGGAQGCSSVSVTLPLASITISPDGSTLTSGTTTLTATGKNGAGADVGAISVVWSSLNPSVATVNASTGVVTPVGSGQVTIKATSGAVSGYAIVNVALPLATPVNLWQLVPVNATATLRDVAGFSPSDIYVVGDGGEVRRFNGSAWNVVATGAANDMQSVCGASPTDIWIGGTVSASNNLVHFNGSNWTSMSTQASGAAQVLGVWCGATNDVFASGVLGTLYRYNLAGWPQQTTGTTANLLEVWGASSNSVIAVGTGGTALHFNGTTWAPKTTGTTAHLQDVWGTGTSDAYAVGTGGTILRYNGSNWNPMTSGTTTDLRGVWGSSGTDVYAVGSVGTILRFDGTAWSPMATLAGDDLYAVWGTSTGSVWIVGAAGTVQRGVRGATITISPANPTIATGGTQALASVAKDEAGVTLSGGMAVSWSSTNTAVATVTSQGVVTAVAPGSTSICANYSGGAQGCTTVSVGQAVGSITVSPNGVSLTGGTANLSATAKDGVGAPMSGVTFSWSSLNPSIATVNASTGVVTPVASGQVAIAASSGGATGYALVTVSIPVATPVNLWAPVSSGVTSQLAAVWGTDANNIFAVGAGGVIRRFNGSAWTAQASGVTTDINGLSGSSSSDVRAAASPGTVLRFDGSGWTNETTSLNSGIMFGMWAPLPKAAFAFGGDKVFTNLSGSWATAHTFGTLVTGGWGSSVNNVYAVEQSAALPVMARFDGTSWSDVTLPAAGLLRAMWGSTTDVFAVGEAARVFRLNSGTWSTVTTPSGKDLFGIWGSGTTDVYAVGSLGTIERFNGSAWSSMTSGTSEHLYGIWGYANDVYAVGGAGVILRGYRGATVAVTPASPTISTLGGTQQLTATASDANSSAVAGVTGFTWSTNAPSVATVSQSGLVTSVGNGSATICATAPGGVQGCTAVLVGVAVGSVTVTPAGGSLISGTATFTGVARDNGGTIIPDVTFTWSSLNPAVATVNGSTGVVSPVSSGQTTIAATAGGKTGYAVVTVRTPSVTPVNLWASVSSGTGQNLTDIWTSNGSTFASGAHGVVVRHNGTSWSRVDSLGSTNNHWGIGGSSTSDVWAVGDLTQRRFNGSTWSTVASPSIGLVDVWSASPVETFGITAVGIGGVNVSHLLKYDGTAWAKVDSVHNADFLVSMWGSSKGNVYFGSNTGKVRIWNGTSFFLQNVASDRINSIFGVSSDDIFTAVKNGGGVYASANATAGNPTWVHLPEVGVTCCNSVWATSTTELWAATETNGVIARYNGSTWQTFDLGFASRINSVSGTANGDVWAVGDAGVIVRGVRGATVTVTPSAPTMTALGNTQQMTAAAKDAGNATVANAVFTWSSSAPSVATVTAAGLVQAQAPGTTNVCATALGGAQGCTTITVAQTVTSVTVSPAGATLSGGPSNYLATAFDANNHPIAGKTFTWTSGNNNLFSVGASPGTLTPIAAGQAYVQATTDGVSGYALVTVAVPSVTPVNLWATMSTPTGQDLKHVWASFQFGVFAAGNNGVLLRYDQPSWTVADSSGVGDLTGIGGLTPNNYFVAAAGSNSLRFYNGSFFVNQNTGGTPWATWSSAPSQTWVTQTRTPGGVPTVDLLRGSTGSWSPVASIAENAAPRAIWGSAPDAIITVHDGGKIRRFDGSNWTVKSSGGSDYRAVYGVTATDVYVTGVASPVMRSTDNGQNWTALAAIPGASGANDVWGTSTNEVWVATRTAGLLARHNGTTWDTLQTGAGVELFGIGGSSSGEVWAVGGGGKIMRGIRGASVSVAPLTPTITAIGGTVQLTPTAKDGNDNVVTGVTYTWVSSDPANATVSASGLVTAVTAGGTQICARAAGRAEGCTVVTVAPATASIVITPGSPLLTTGPQTLIAAAKDANGNTIGGKTFTWASQNPNVATINASTGQLTPVASGQASVSATVDGITVYATITVALSAATPVNLWATMTSPVLSDERIVGIWGTTSSDVWAIADYNGGLRHRIVRYNGNAAGTWTQQQSTTDAEYYAMWGSSATDILAVGYPPGNATRWNGSTWTTFSVGVSEQLERVWQANPNAAFVGTNTGKIVRFNGSTWTPTTVAAGQSTYSIWGAGESKVYAAFGNGTVGGGTNVFKYDGASWSSVGSVSNAALSSSWGIADTAIFFGGVGSGSSSALYRYNGTSFVPQTHPNIGYVFAIWGSSLSEVYAVGTSGQVIRYNGATWTAVSGGLATVDHLNAVWGTDTGSVFVGGLNGALFRGVRGATVSLGATTLTAIGATHQMSPVAKDAANNTLGGVTYTWSSTTPSVASVSSTGLVTAVANGTTSVCATAPGGAQACATVTVSHLGLQTAHGWAGLGAGFSDAASPRLTGLNISGANRLLVCVVGIDNWASAIAVSSIAVDDGSGGGAQSLSQLGTYYSAPADGAKWSTWYLVGATTGSGRRVVASLSGTPAASSIACASYVGADQSQPFGTIAMSSGVSPNAASLTVTSSSAGALPWAHLTSSNTGYAAGAGVANRQASSSDGLGSYLVDANAYYPSGNSHTFNFNYGGSFGAQGAVICPATFGCSVTPGAAARIELRVGNGQVLAAGAAVPTLPSVVVRDAAGNPVSGVVVTFAVASGGGAATGLTPTTDAFGVATVGSWTLGAAAAINTMTATVTGLTGSPVTFTATGVGPLAIVDVTPNAATVSTGTTALAANATDAIGNPISGASFTWSSLNTNVATVNASTGVVTPVGPGQVVIAASASGKTGYALITVTSVAPVAVNLWSPMSSGTTEPIAGVWGTSASNVFAVGNSGTLLRYNGSSWAPASVTSKNITAVWGSSASDVFAVAGPSTCCDLQLLHFNGTSWSEMDRGALNGGMRALWGSAPTSVIAGGTTGAAGSVLTFDGTTWTQPAGASGTIESVWGSSRSNVYAAGWGSSVLRFDGSSWATVPTGASQTVSSVWGTSASDVYAVGGGGTALRFNGSNWSALTTNTSQNLSTVWGTSSSDIYVAGENGAILRYDGSTFTPMSTGTTEVLYDFWGAPTGEVFVVGAGGTILKGYRGASVTVAPAAPTLTAVGATQQLTPTAKDAGNNTVAGVVFTWSSSDETKATVSASGLVTAVANGTTSVCATASGGAQACTTVTVAQATVSIEVNPNGAVISGNTQFTATAKDANGNAIAGKEFTWGALSGDVLSVNSLGVVTPATSGAVTIYARADGVDGYALVNAVRPDHGPVNLWVSVPSPTGQELRDVWTVTGSNSFAVGSEGVVLRFEATTGTWSKIDSGSTTSLLSVRGTGINDVFAVGASGVLRRYNGAAWSSGFFSAGFRDVWAATPQDVFAVGGTPGARQVLMRFNGSGWTALDSVSGGTSGNHAVWGGSATDVVMAVGGGTVAKWNGTTLNTASTGSGDVNALWGIGTSDLYAAVATSGVKRSTDGGINWTSLPAIPGMGTACCTNIWGASATEVWVTSQQAGVLARFNGTSWDTVHTDAGVVLNAISGMSNGDLWAVGAAGRIVRGVRGATVSLAPSAPTLTAVGATVSLTPSAKDALSNAVPGTVLYEWSMSDTDVATVDAAGVVTAVGPGTASICAKAIGGAQGCATITVAQATASVVVSPPGGAVNVGAATTFTATAKDANGNAISGATFAWTTLNSSVGTVNSSGQATGVGEGQVVVTATTAGVTGTGLLTVANPTAAPVNLWAPQSTGASGGSTLFATWASSASNVYVVGENGNVRRFNGTAWSSAGLTSTEPLRDVWGLSNNLVYALGRDTVFRYDGSSWEPVLSFPTFGGEFNTIWGSSDKDIYVASALGVVRRYDGSSWTTVSGLPTQAWNKIWGRAADDIYVVGAGPSVYHFDGTAWTSVSTGLSASPVWGVWGFGANNVFALTQSQLARFTGSWSIASNTASGNVRLWGSSDTDLFGVNCGGSGPVMHFDGSNWSGIVLDVGPFCGIGGSPGGPVYAVGAVTFAGYRNASVEVAPSAPTLTSVGSTQQLTATAKDASANTIGAVTFTWSSATPAVATVNSSGLVTAVASGTSSVCATAPGGAQGCTTVTVTLPVASISIAGDGALITADGSPLTATAKDANGDAIAGQTFAWTSLNPDVATVNATTGAVTVLRSGQVTVSASANSITTYALVTVTLPAAAPINLWRTVTSGTSSALRNVWGLTANNVFAVGAGGTILRFDGSSWSPMSSGTSVQLNSVWGTSASNVFAVGVGGTILRYDGSTWAPMSSGTNENIEGVWGTSPTDVFVVAGGGAIRHFDGSSWTGMISGTVETLNAIWGSGSAPSTGGIWVVGNGGKILHYDGTLWGSQSSQVTQNLVDVWGWGPDVFAAGGPVGTILRSPSDTWTAMTHGAAGSVQSVWGSNANDLYAVGESGAVLRHNGTAWSIDTVPSTSLVALWGRSNGDAWAVGDDGVIIRGVRGASVSLAPSTPTITAIGATQQLTPTAKDAGNNTLSGVTYKWTSATPSVATVSGSGLVTAVASGTASICATAPGGAQGCTTVTVAQTVSSVEVSPDSASISSGTRQLTATAKDAGGASISGVTFTWASLNTSVATVSSSGVVTPLKSGQVTICGTADSFTNCALVTVSIDGAAAVSIWRTDTTGVTASQLNQVWGANDGTVFAVGTSGTILRRTGSAWSVMTTPTSEHLDGLWGTSSSDVFAAGENGAILHFDGTSWTQMTSNSSAKLLSVWGSSPSDVFVSGVDGIILHYDGTTWSPMTSSTSVNLWGIWGLSSRNVFAVGESGVIVHYDGTSWTPMTSNTDERLLDLWGVSPNAVFAAGDYGVHFYNGSTWSMITGTDGASQDVRGSYYSGSSADVFAVGLFGVLRKLNGTTWSAGEEWPGNPHLRGVWATNSGDVFVVGNDGTMIRGVRGGTVSIAPTSPTLGSVGATQQLTPTAKDASDNTLTGVTYTWSSSDEAKATVDASGLVTAVANGTSSVCATAIGGAQACTTVTVDQVATSIAISPTGASIAGGTKTFTATAKDANNNTISGQAFTWTSLNTGVATVNSSGVASAVSPGQTIVSATADGVTRHAVITIAPASAAQVNLWVPMSSGVTEGLNGVWGTSESNVYAVGEKKILRFDGSSWSTVVSDGAATFNAVGGTSASDVHVVGYSGDVRHFDGSAWSSVSGPAGAYFGVWGAAPNDVHVGGANELLSNSTGSFALKLAANGDVRGIWGAAPDSVYAAVFLGSPAIYRYDGSAWVTTGLTGFNYFSIWGSSASNVYAVGTNSSLAQWDGSNWSTSTLPAGGFHLFGIHGTGPADVWAVGDGGKVVRYNGTAWSSVPVATSENLRGVWASNTVFMVGSNGTILRGYRGGSVTVTPSAPFMAIGATTTITATAKDASNNVISGATFTWTTSNPAIATVNSAGVVTAAGFGTVDITATAPGGAAASATVTVAEVASLVVSPNGASITTGTQAFSTIAKDASDNTLITAAPTWASLNPVVATINATSGVASPEVSGQATISATIGSNTAYGVVTVAQPSVTPVTLWVPTTVTGLGSLNVWAASENAVYAVGSYGSGSEVFKFNGTSWSQVFSRSVAGGGNLVQAWGSSATDVWATGNFSSFVHLTGGSWTAVASTGCQTFMIWGADPNNVFATCNSVSAARYGGSSWASMTAPPCAISNIYGFSATDVWGVCGSGPVVRWDGSAWTTVGNFAGESPGGIWGTGPNDVWIVGSSGLVRRWNGSSWETPGTPPVGAPFRQISGSNGNDVYVTTASASGHVYHYDGTNWTITMSEANGVDDIWAAPGGSVWVSGNASGKVWRGYRGATVTMSPTLPTFFATGAVQQMTASPKDASNNAIVGATITWTSRNPSVATVNSSGLVTSVGAGTAMIVAEATGGAADSTLVTVGLGTLALQRSFSGVTEIWTISTDGTGLTQRTLTSSVAGHPKYNANGTKLLFNSNVTGQHRIYVANADGSSPTNISTAATTNDHSAVWSPDGTKVAFISDRVGTTEVWTMDADGSNQARLTFDGASVERPAWSPDGTKIAFSTTRDGQYEVYVMNTDGTGLTNLTNNAGIDAYPSWSPDGTKIAFVSDRSGATEVYTMTAAGGSVTRLTFFTDNALTAQWSPDGRNIAVTTVNAGSTSYGLWMMNSDGSNQVNFYNQAAYVEVGSWKPTLP